MSIATDLLNEFILNKRPLLTRHAEVVYTKMGTTYYIFKDLSILECNPCFDGLPLRVGI